MSLSYQRKARSDHKCARCEGLIPKGRPMLTEIKVSIKGATCLKYHPICKDVLELRQKIDSVLDKPYESQFKPIREEGE